ncbi:hypothetical protein SAMN05421640_3388 [Ekhidna lutea]|uniref:Uncharacterized protein n=1 Tax=Ekhidna lutea TaxID=447679 RepID=A0A239LMH1_EKHLU|nr:hypothetical protein SAMN05421640_3388 [Ekhidna lutea]
MTTYEYSCHIGLGTQNDTPQTKLEIQLNINVYKHVQSKFQTTC